MKKVFLDTNILLDFFAARPPFNIEAAKIFNLTYSKTILSYVSTLSYANSFYYLKKIIGRRTSIEVLADMKKIVSTINLD